MRALDYNLTISKIQEWIRDFVESAQVDGVIVGMSGGIDSTLISTLCVNAIGREHVIGLGLPCLSIPQDLNDAKMVADQLGIDFIVFDLSSVFEEFLKITSAQIEPNIMAKANLKARLRMLTNYFVGQSKGRFLVAGTGNRTELAIGYFTKYGDGGVDFEPIGGLYKCEVGEIARILKIPESIINKPPSAGLWEGQTDEGEIGMAYDVVDEIIYRIDYNLNLSDLSKYNIKKVKRMMSMSKHKLRMAPAYEIFKR